MAAAATLPESNAWGSASSGPYVVKADVDTPLPRSASSRQYEAVWSTGR
jgi:hypothetical protein